MEGGPREGTTVIGEEGAWGSEKERLHSWEDWRGSLGHLRGKVHCQVASKGQGHHSALAQPPWAKAGAHS